VREPARRPCRVAFRKSSPDVSRCSRGSKAARIRASSDGELAAALAAARGQDGAAGTSAHAQAETVHLVATTVVRLVGTLAHGDQSPIRIQGLSTPSARGSAATFGWHRPPAAVLSGGHSWTCGTGRHRVTEQRYALGENRVKPACRQPVDEGLIGPPSTCYVRPLQGSPPPQIEPVEIQPVTPVTEAQKWPLTCENTMDRCVGVGREDGFSTRRILRSQPVDKVVD